MKNLFPVVSANDFLHADSMFDNFFQGFASRRLIAPKVDIEDKGNAYELTADLPGIDKEHISVTYDNDVLTLSAMQEEQQDEQDEQRRYIRKERISRSFRRQFVVQNIDRNAIQAVFKDGVLTIHLPKEDPRQAERSNRIEIQ